MTSPLTLSIVVVLLFASPPLFAQVSQDVIDRFEAHEYAAESGRYAERPMPYRLLKPKNIEEGKKYPLVVFLHGAGERGGDNVAQLKFLPAWLSEPEAREEYPAFLIAPQCPKERTWGSVNWDQQPYRYAEQPVDEMRAVLGALRQVMAKHPVDPDRVYLTGLSMGGFGSWELATRHPELFAAVAPICGGGDTSRVEPLVGLPLWAWHGAADEAVPVERSREMIEAVKEAGGEPKYTELPGVGHNSWTPAYQREDGVLPWLFKQRKD